MNFDLLVIGNTVAGREAAVAAALRGAHVGLVAEPLAESTTLGRAIHENSLAFVHETIADLPEFLRVEAQNLRRPGSAVVNVRELRRQLEPILRLQQQLNEDQLHAHGIEILAGRAQLLDSHTVRLLDEEGTELLLDAERIVIATGTEAGEPDYCEFDGNRVLNIEELWDCEQLPEEVAIVGGSSTGLETAALLAKLGVRVTVFDGSHQLPCMAEPRIAARFATTNAHGVELRLGEDVIQATGTSEGARVMLAGGERVTTGLVLVAVERWGRSEGLGLAAAGVGCDERGRLWCNREGITWTPHIFAAGDITGCPITTQASMPAPLPTKSVTSQRGGERRGNRRPARELAGV